MERKDYQGSVIKVQAKRIEHEDLVDLIVGGKVSFQNIRIYHDQLVYMCVCVVL